MKSKKMLVAAVITGSSFAAHADDYGCKVLLCLSNPNGPMAEQQCQPPIQRFLREQAEKPPKPFPQCPEAKGQAGVTQGINPYDSCPEGTTALGAGVSAIQGMPEIAQRQRFQPYRPYGVAPGTVVVDASQVPKLVAYTGIGDGNRMRVGQGKLVCAGNKIGMLMVRFIDGTGDNREVSMVSFAAYDRIVTMDPAKGSARYFDVSIDNKPYRRVRF
jgi:hypothetical protein